MTPFALLLLIAASSGTMAPNKARPIERVSPAAFREVPTVVTKTLAAMKCAIPQPWPAQQLQNLVVGHFRSKSRLDYAALCSRGGASSVIVVNGRTGAVLAQLNRRRDDFYVQGVGDGTMAFSRVLSTVAPSPTGFCLDAIVPCPCKPARYDGIDDAFEGKASETHCWRNGWHTVVSGD